jgi:hypothetical protein
VKSTTVSFWLFLTFVPSLSWQTIVSSQKLTPKHNSLLPHRAPEEQRLAKVQLQHLCARRNRSTDGRAGALLAPYSHHRRPDLIVLHDRLCDVHKLLRETKHGPLFSASTHFEMKTGICQDRLGTNRNECENEEAVLPSSHPVRLVQHEGAVWCVPAMEDITGYNQAVQGRSLLHRLQDNRR